MKGIRFLILIAVVALTSANPTPNDTVLITSVTEDIPVKENHKAPNECLPFAKPADCEEVRLNGNTASGVYLIWPRNRKTCKAMEVYCDMNEKIEGGGWTLLQRRGQYGNAENYFNKTWEIYKHGFGDLEKEFWLGNEKIFALTNQGSYSVRFDMRLVNGTSAFAVYDQFWIENENQKYQLNIAGYSGNAGDGMSYHHSMKFSTVDNVNDEWPGVNCASRHSGGWWFNRCIDITGSHLNGQNKNGKYDYNKATGIIWLILSGDNNSLEYTEIKIKPHLR